MWDEAEEQRWQERQRQVGASPVSHTTPLPWDPPACSAQQTSSHLKESLPDVALNPSLPLGWPTGVSFAEDCYVLQTLDPRVCPNSFTIFDVALQVRIVPKPRGAGEVALRDLARQHCRHLVPPIHIHKLRDEVPGFPSPQFTASAGELSRQAFAIPIDLRPSGWGVCVTLTRIGASLLALANDARAVCPVTNFGPKLVKHTLVASSAGSDIYPYDPVPVDADHIRVRRSGINPDPHPSSTHGHWTQVSPEHAEHEDAVLGHIDIDGRFLVAVHAPGCSSTTIEAHVFDSPHTLVRRASRHFLHTRPHATVQASWPTEQPRDREHLLHLALEFDVPRTPAETMYLVDCRGVGASEGQFVAFVERRDLTAGEFFAILRDKVTCRLPPAAVLVNNRPLANLDTRRYKQSAPAPAHSGAEPCKSEGTLTRSVRPPCPHRMCCAISRAFRL